MRVLGKCPVGLITSPEPIPEPHPLASPYREPEGSLVAKVEALCRAKPWAARSARAISTRPKSTGSQTLISRREVSYSLPAQGAPRSRGRRRCWAPAPNRGNARAGRCLRRQTMVTPSPRLETAEAAQRRRKSRPRRPVGTVGTVVVIPTTGQGYVVRARRGARTDHPETRRDSSEAMRWREYARRKGPARGRVT